MNGPPRLRLVVAACALERGPLVKEAEYWRFGRRLFSAETVNILIALGVGRRVGNAVVWNK